MEVSIIKIIFVLEARSIYGILPKIISIDLYFDLYSGGNWTGFDLQLTCNVITTPESESPCLKTYKETPNKDNFVLFQLTSILTSILEVIGQVPTSSELVLSLRPENLNLHV